MSEHAAVKPEHRGLIERLEESIVQCENFEGAAQLLADFERDARVKEAEYWHFLDAGKHDCAHVIKVAHEQSIYPSWHRGIADCEHIAQLKRGAL